jgi:hypothetical protein
MADRHIRGDVQALAHIWRSLVEVRWLDNPLVLSRFRSSQTTHRQPDHTGIEGLRVNSSVTDVLHSMEAHLLDIARRTFEQDLTRLDDTTLHADFDGDCARSMWDIQRVQHITNGGKQVMTR